MGKDKKPKETENCNIEEITISDQEKDILQNEINEFTDWLRRRKIISESLKIEHTFDFPFVDEDFIMTVNTQKQLVSFNTFIRRRCSFEYYKVVILHEFFHLAVQKVPNKDDATKIKDDFGAELMKLIDIEADFYVALYLKECKDYSLVKYWVLNYEGGTVFVDKWIRNIKFERFIGTLLSISKMFIEHRNNPEDFFAFDLYLPTISPIYTEDSLHVLVVKKEHIYFDEIKANYQDFAKLKERYKDVTNYTLKGYVSELINFSCKALELQIPLETISELDTLKD